MTLLEAELVDELNVLLCPVVLGGGKRLFGEGTVPTVFALASSRTTSTGVVLATYRPRGKPSYGTIGA